MYKIPQKEQTGTLNLPAAQQDKAKKHPKAQWWNSRYPAG